MTVATTALAALLEAVPPHADTLAGWWSATSSHRARFAATIDRALVGGAYADRLGFAFASGYAEALRFLVERAARSTTSSTTTTSTISALCATEHAGNHPRAIRTALAPNRAGDG